MTTDRAYWEAKAPVEILKVVDSLVEMANAHTDANHSANYSKNFIGLHNGSRANNFVTFKPRKKFLRLIAKKIGSDEWIERLEEAGVSAETRKGNLVLRVTPHDLSQHRDLIDSAVQAAAAAAVIDC